MKQLSFNYLALCLILAAPSRLLAQIPDKKSEDAVPAKWGFSLEHEEKRARKITNSLLRFDAADKPYVSIIDDEQEIEIRDDKGKIKRKIAKPHNPKIHLRTRVHVGDYGNVMAVHITSGHSPTRESWTEGEYYILNDKGEVTLHLKPFNDNTSPIPSPSGDYAIGWPGPMGPGGPPIFYDAAGHRNKWAHGFTGEGWPDSHEVQEAKFSPDGSRVVVIALGPNFAPGATAGSHFLIVYDSNGNKLWERKLDNIKRASAVFSPKGTYLLLMERQSPAWSPFLTLLTMAGVPIWRIPYSGGDPMFSDDESLLFIAGSNPTGTVNTVESFEIPGGKLRWNQGWNSDLIERLKKDAGSPGATFRIYGLDVALRSQAVVILGTAFRQKKITGGGHADEATTSVVAIFSVDGKLLGETALPPTLPYVAGNGVGVKISPDGSAVTIPTQRGWLRYRIKKGDGKPR